MPRPIRCRKIDALPEFTYFKPAGIPARLLAAVTLTLDEFEAIRLADLEGLYQEEAARRMNVSRQTFGNILVAAHQKIAECVICGKALKIEGGTVEQPFREFACRACQHIWRVASADECPTRCPNCQDARVQHAPQATENCADHHAEHGCHRRRCRRQFKDTPA